MPESLADLELQRTVVYDLLHRGESKMSELIVLGPNKLLGAQIIGRLLAGTTHYVTWVIDDLDSYIAEELRSLIYKNSVLREAAKPRFALIEWNAGIESNIKADEIW